MITFFCLFRLLGLVAWFTISPSPLLLQILSSNNYFAVYLQPFNNLRSLELHTGFKKNNVLGLACLFRSSPTLHTLILKIINDYKIERRVSYMHALLLINLFSSY